METQWNFAVSKWKDKRDVLTISNKHKLELVPVKNKRGEVRMKPNTERDYNNGMSGIDRSDQIFSYYQGSQKSVWWYKKTGFHFIEMFVHNSFYLFKQANPQNKMTLFKFRTEVVKSLLNYEKLSQIERRGSNNACYPKLIPASEKKNPILRCKRCYKNGQCRETRYQCVPCEDKPLLCGDPCFVISWKPINSIYSIYRLFTVL